MSKKAADTKETAPIPEAEMVAPTLTPQQAADALRFLVRVDLKGGEAPALTDILFTLQLMAKGANMPPPMPAQ